MTKKNVPEVRFKGFTNSWGMCPFGKIAESFSYGLNAAAIKYDGIHKYIRITDIDDTTHAFLENDLTSPKTDLTKANDYILKEGDLLFARTGASVGKTYLYKKENGLVYFAGFLIRAKIKSDYDPEFVFQNTLTNHYLNYIRLTSQRSGQPGVNAQEYSEFSIMTPAQDEQKKIGISLQNIDRLIALHSKRHEKLFNVKKAMLEKMFPKDGADVCEIRFKGFTDSWKLLHLSDEVDFFSGLTYSPLDVVKDDGTLVLRSSNVQEGEVSFHDNVYVRSGVVNSSNVSEGDIIVVVRNGSRNLIGKHAQIKKPMSNTVIGAFMTGIRPRQSSFINALLDTNLFSKEVEKNLGATINQITTGMFKKMKFMFPKSEEQKEIGAYFDNLNELIVLHREELGKLKNIKKAMLKKMFV